MSLGTIISLADYSGNFVRPWVEAGYRAVLVDPQHDRTYDDGKILRIAATILDAHAILSSVIRNERVVFVAGWPPCTDVATSGSRWFKLKKGVDPHFQAKAALVAEQCRMVGMMSGAPWSFENPVSVFSSIFGKPSYIFHPHHYTGYFADDNYNKTTCLWTSDDFIMPPPLILPDLPEPDNRIHTAAPGPERANFRSETPNGFTLAVFIHNAPHLKGK